MAKQTDDKTSEIMRRRYARYASWIGGSCAALLIFLLLIVISSRKQERIRIQPIQGPHVVLSPTIEKPNGPPSVYRRTLEKQPLTYEDMAKLKQVLQQAKDENPSISAEELERLKIRTTLALKEEQIKAYQENAAILRQQYGHQK